MQFKSKLTVYFESLLYKKYKKNIKYKHMNCLKLFQYSFIHLYEIRWLRIPQRIQVLHGCAPSYRSFVLPTYRVDELFAPPTLAASSSHSPTGPPLATEPFLLLVPRSGTVCHRRSHQRHHWTPFAGVWRLICSPCHIRTYNYRNWLTSVSGPCSNFLLRPL